MSGRLEADLFTYEPWTMTEAMKRHEQTNSTLRR